MARISLNGVAPVRERGLKCTGTYNREGSASRSREGAWIEIIVHPDHYPMTLTVAPVRERGLKYQDTSKRSPHGSRSREGAWIEIAVS